MFTRYNEPEMKVYLRECAFVDPRFKLRPYLSAEEQSTVKSRVRQRMVSLDLYMDTDEGETVEYDELQQVAKRVCPLEATTESPINNLLGTMFKTDTGASDENISLSAHDRANKELELYCLQNPICLTDSPLLWWKDHAKIYPMIANVAQHDFAVQATSVSSERMFSGAGEIVSTRRSCLDPELVDALLFLNKNVDKL